MATKKDANGNTESYSYDANQRLTAIPDRQQTFTYDTCPTTNATGCVSMPGQLVQATFGNSVGPEQLNFAYNYALHPRQRLHLLRLPRSPRGGFGVLGGKLHLRQSGRPHLRGISGFDIPQRRRAFHLYAGRHGAAHRPNGQLLYATYMGQRRHL